MMPASILLPAFTYLCVLARVGGMIALAPIFSAQVFPKRLRMMLAFAIALVVTPSQFNIVNLPDNFIATAQLLVREAAIGASLGLGVAIFLSAAQIAGQVVSQISGLSLVEVYSPGADAELPLLSHLLHMTALAVFLTIGGQRLLVSALMETYSAFPIAASISPQSISTIAADLLAQSFSLALRIAAPAVIALSLATILLGMVSRTLPHANLWSLGFAINTLAAFAVLAVSVSAIGWLLQDELEPALSTVLSGLRLS